MPNPGLYLQYYYSSLCVQGVPGSAGGGREQAPQPDGVPLGAGAGLGRGPGGPAAPRQHHPLTRPQDAQRLPHSQRDAALRRGGVAGGLQLSQGGAFFGWRQLPTWHFSF